MAYQASKNRVGFAVVRADSVGSANNSTEDQSLSHRHRSVVPKPTTTRGPRPNVMPGASPPAFRLPEVDSDALPPPFFAGRILPL